MKYKPLILLLLLFKAFPSFAFQMDTVQLFYHIDKYDLSPADKIKLKAFVDSTTNADTIQVLGYADFLGNKQHNLVLSANRAQTVKMYLRSLNKGIPVLADAKGRVPATVKKTVYGQPSNRRVDVIKIIKTSITDLTIEPPHIKSNVTKPDSAPPEIQAKLDVDLKPRSFQEKINDLSKLDIGGSMSIEELTFKPGRHILNPESEYYVKILLKYLQDHSNIVFEIQGHICCDVDNHEGYDWDTKDYNLSTNRARAIYHYFLQNGIAAERMTYKGLGSSKPKVSPEITSHDKYLNRRVEILIINK